VYADHPVVRSFLANRGRAPSVKHDQCDSEAVRWPRVGAQRSEAVARAYCRDPKCRVATGGKSDPLRRQEAPVAGGFKFGWSVLP
jgi:hypothetical protein